MPSGSVLSMAEQPPVDGLKQSIDKVLAHHNRRTSRKTATATKSAKKRKRRNGVSALDQAQVDALVTPEAQRHGDYRVSTIKLQEVVEGGKVKTKEHTGVRNLARSQVERWATKERLDERQMAAIMCFQEAHRRVFGEGPRVTASYSPAVSRHAHQSIELYASSWFRAKETLRLIDNEVVTELPFGHWDVWVNVVIWDEPHGVAGSRIGYSFKGAEAATFLVVSTIAHRIANLVIDNSRKDFAEYIRQLDELGDPK